MDHRDVRRWIIAACERFQFGSRDSGVRKGRPYVKVTLDMLTPFPAGLNLTVKPRMDTNGHEGEVVPCKLDQTPM